MVDNASEALLRVPSFLREDILKFVTSAQAIRPRVIESRAP